MKLESLVALHNDLVTLDPNELTAVSYDPNNGLVYRQIGKVVMTPYISYLYFPKKLKWGLLTPNAFVTLITNLEKLIQDKDVTDGYATCSPKLFRTEVYKIFRGSEQLGPQLYADLTYVDVTNSLVVKYLLNKFSESSRVLLKSLKLEFSKK